MQEKELKFSHKPRLKESTHCPCGEPQKRKNPQFAPFDGFNGEFGYCHQCKKTFMPENTKDTNYVFIPPVKVAQKFVEEPIWNWILQDVMIDPKPDDPLKIDGRANITFYYRNIKGKIATAKKMVYNFPSFKREHSIHPVSIYTRDSGYYLCLFYEHDLDLFPAAKVILVESEKTAALLRYKFKNYLHEFIYLAVSGSNGLTDEKIEVLRDRDVLICYDCDNGTPQPDGSIKSPKGREAAQSAYVKLAPISRATVIDIDPSKDDGTDLGDIVKTIDIEYIRNLHQLEADTTKIPEGLTNELRSMNRAGEEMTPETIERLGQEYNINGDKITEMYKTTKKVYQKEAGLDDAPPIKRIECWLTDHYDFRRNSINSKLFYRAKGNSKFIECENADVWRGVHYDIKAVNKNGKDSWISEKILNMILLSQYVDKWNPIEEYFKALPQWDGVDHIRALGNHIQTDDQEFWLEQFKKSLIRMIACGLGKYVNRIVMTLVQEAQESGKSSFIRFLSPPDLEPYFKESPMDHDKDSEIALTENFIWNLEELADLNKKQVADMKAIVSMDIVKRRRSYGHNEVSMRRIVNFWGSTNKTEFLVDTQNTRWLCFNVISVNHDYHNKVTGVQNIDINKVWAQAYHLYKTGFEYTLSAIDREKRDRNNRSFESMPEEKQMILRYLKPAKKDEPGSTFMVTFEIKEFLHQNTSAKTRVNENNITRSLKQLGFEQVVKKIQGKAARGYWVFTQLKPIEYDRDTFREPELFPGTDGEIELPF